MLTRTHTYIPETPAENIPAQVENDVKERGFALYEWISPDELSMSVKRDYLAIVKWASIPLAIITAIFGFLGLAAGPIGVILSVLVVLGFFYGIVFLILLAKLSRRAYHYTRMADVVITDDHYVVGKSIFKNTEKEKIKNALSYFETTFEEPFLGTSALPHSIESKKEALFSNLKDIALGGGKLIQSVGRSRDSDPIILALMAAGLLYGGMMAIVYTLGIFFISVFGRAFSWLAYQVLLMTNDTEHRIQELFSKIDRASKSLDTTSDEATRLLDEAGRNEWKENLLGKINESNALISELASTATSDTTKLRKILENSKYKDIFNFSKYGSWVKREILEPINAILLLLEKNRDTLRWLILSLETQIKTTTESSHRTPLELQKKRLELQVESFERMIVMMKWYQEKLKD